MSTAMSCGRGGPRARTSLRLASASSAPPSASWATSPRPTAACRSWKSPPRAPSWATCASMSRRCARRSPASPPGCALVSDLAALRRACRGRPDLLRVFLEIQIRAALAGNNLEGPVRPHVGRIAAALGVSRLELAHIEAVLRLQRGGFRPGEARGAGAAARDRSLEEAYSVLESTAGASNEAVIKA